VHSFYLCTVPAACAAREYRQRRERDTVAVSGVILRICAAQHDTVKFQTFDCRDIKNRCTALIEHICVAVGYKQRRGFLTEGCVKCAGTVGGGADQRKTPALALSLRFQLLPHRAKQFFL